MTTTPATQAVTPELLPCPNGHDAIAVEFDDEFEAFVVECDHEGCNWRTWADTRVEAIATWNTRQTHSLPGDVGTVAEIKAHVDRYTVHDDARRIYSAAQLETAIRLALAALTPSALSGDAGEGE